MKAASTHASARAAALCLGVALLGGVPVAVMAQHNQDSSQATGDQTAGDQSAQDANAAQDAQIESKVVIALSSANELKGQQVQAATQDGEVLLTGNVNDQGSKDLAQRLASQVAGVRSVTNNLAIGPASQDQDPSQTQAADQNQAADQQTQDPNQNQQAAQAQAGPPPPMQDPNQQPQAAPAPPQQQGNAAPYPYPSGPAPAPYPDQNQAGGDQSGNYPNQPGYNQPNGYPNAYPNQPPRRMPYDPNPYQQQGNPGQYARQNSGPVTLPASTILRVRTADFLDARKLQPGDTFQVTAANDIFLGGVVAVPRGAVLQGVVTADRPNTSGSLKGSSSLSLQLTNLVLGGRSYPIATDLWTGKGPGKGAFTANNTIGGAAIGAVIGGLIGRGPGAAVGAVAGGATGAAASSAANGPRFVVPPESILTFHLTQPVTFNPVSYQEAQRLAASVPPAPYLRQRAYYPPPPPPPPYYYGRVYPY